MSRFLVTLDKYELVYNDIGLKTIQVSRDLELNLTYLFPLFDLNIVGKSGNIYKVESMYCRCDFYIIDIIQINKDFLFIDTDFTQSLDIHTFYQDI